MKKKLLSAILSVAMIASLLAGCGGKGEEPQAASAETETQTQEQEASRGSI